MKTELLENKKICYLCGYKIFKKKYIANQPQFPLNATVDHVIPRSKGGTNMKSNKAIAHKICNEWKNDNIIVDPLEYAAQLAPKIKKILIHYQKYNHTYDIKRGLRYVVDMYNKLHPVEITIEEMKWADDGGYCG